MRQERTVQASIFDLFARHEMGCELKKGSQWLDEHPALSGLVAADLRRDGVQETGRHGLPAESVLRCAPGSRPASPVSSGPTAWPVAPGAGSTTKRPTSGP